MEAKPTRTIDAALLDIMERLMVNVRVVQHGFRRNASDVQARPAEGTTLLYTRGLRQKKP
jgi:hypothetical protein